MSRKNYDRIFSLPAAAAILDGQPLVVNTSGQFAIAGANVIPHAIADGDFASGAMARAVAVGAIMRGYAHGTIAVGDKVKSDGTGFIKGATTGDLWNGVALTATTTGKHFELLITGYIGTSP